MLFQLIQESPTAATVSEPDGNSFTVYPPGTDSLFLIVTFSTPIGIGKCPGFVGQPQLVKNQKTIAPAQGRSRKSFWCMAASGCQYHK